MTHRDGSAAERAALAALADVMSLLQERGAIPSMGFLARRWRTDLSLVSRWCQLWLAAGYIVIQPGLRGSKMIMHGPQPPPFQVEEETPNPTPYPNVDTKPTYPVLPAAPAIGELRVIDVLAAQAMVGILAYGRPMVAESVATAAYRYAEAMLRESQRRTKA